VGDQDNCEAEIVLTPVESVGATHLSVKAVEDFRALEVIAGFAGVELVEDELVLPVEAWDESVPVGCDVALDESLMDNGTAMSAAGRDSVLSAGAVENGCAMMKGALMP
jgi:hypothetical protein